MLHRSRVMLTLATGLIMMGVLFSYHATAQNDSRTFPETGQSVRGRFLQYWQQNGGLPQQGYPISGELREVSDLDGKTYTVQYFERATFELHPENQPPNDVLLSQLGTFRYAEKYRPKPTAIVPLQPAGVRRLEERIRGEPVTRGDYICWQDDAKTIKCLNLANNEQTEVRSSFRAKGGLATDGRTLVWFEDDGTVYGYTFSNKRTATLLINVGGLQELALDQNILFYRTATGSQHGIIRRDLTSDLERVISFEGRDLVAKEGRLLYTEEDKHNKFAVPGWSLVVADLNGANGVGYSGNGGSFSGYDVAGSDVVFATNPPGYILGVQLLNRDTRQQTALTDRPTSLPVISTRKIAWVEDFGSTVKVYDRASKQTTTLVQTEYFSRIVSLTFTERGQLVYAQTNPNERAIPALNLVDLN